MSPSPTATVSAELAAVLRRLKLGQMLDTLPERLTLARQGPLPHADFLEMVLNHRGAGARWRRRASSPPGGSTGGGQGHDGNCVEPDVRGD